MEHLTRAALLKRATQAMIAGLAILCTGVLANSAVPEPELVKAAEIGDVVKVQSLLRQGASVDQTGRYGSTALMRAADHGHREVVALLLEHGANVNATDDEHGTALMAAAFKGHKEIVKLLLNKAARVDVADKSGGTALTYALAGGHTDIVELLESRGAATARPVTPHVPKVSSVPTKTGGPPEPSPRSKYEPQEQQSRPGPWVIADSDRRYLTDSDLAGLSPDQLWKARNEIFARHGYIFKTPRGKAYAKSLGSFYRGVESNMASIYRSFNKFETHNVRMIERRERRR